MPTLLETNLREVKEDMAKLTKQKIGFNLQFHTKTIIFRTIGILSIF